MKLVFTIHQVVLRGDKGEGNLSAERSRVVSNMRLMNVNKAFNLHSAMENCTIDFKKFFIPPGFTMS